MSKIDEALKELNEQEAAYIVLVLAKPENPDDKLMLQVETNLEEVPELVITILDTAFESLIGKETPIDEL